MSSPPDPPFRLGVATTLQDYLRGTWRVDRTLRDTSSGQAGTFTGRASFTDDDGTLHHEERGILAWAGAAPTPATRSLVWRPGVTAHAVDVFFPDGRLFHRLDLSTGSDSPVHPCSPDVYRGSFVLQGADAWAYTWRVSGPHKQLLLTTLLVRLADGY